MVMAYNASPVLYLYYVREYFFPCNPAHNYRNLCWTWRHHLCVTFLGLFRVETGIRGEIKMIELKEGEKLAEKGGRIREELRGIERIRKI